MRLFILWLAFLLLAYTVFEWLNAIPYEKSWGSEWSPKRQWELVVMRRPRELHQAPDIVLYQQLKDKTRRKIDLLRLDEDDRADLHYEIDWMDDNNALFSISCSNCVNTNVLYLQLELNEKQPIATRIHPDSLLKQESRWSGVVGTDKIND